MNNAAPTYNQLNAEYQSVEEQISALSLQLEALYTKRGELRDQLNTMSRRPARGLRVR